MKKALLFCIVILATILVSSDVEAQCAMCKAAQNSSGFSSRGLNSGILYLMAIPYVAFSFLAYFWYKSSKKQKSQDQKLAAVLKDKI